MRRTWPPTGKVRQNKTAFVGAKLGRKYEKDMGPQTGTAYDPQADTTLEDENQLKHLRRSEIYQYQAQKGDISGRLPIPVAALPVHSPPILGYKW